MREQWHAFLNAVMFFTRIPVNPPYSPELLNKAGTYFPLVGVLVGGFAVLVYWPASHLWGHNLAVWLSMAATIWMTGAFHEDGFADFCDGFGGGYGRDRILEIMKDSRIGTYGSVGLILILGCKALALQQLPPSRMVLVLVAGHCLSRFASSLLIFFGTYVTADLRSKAKPLATRMSLAGFIMTAVFGCLPLVVCWWLWPLPHVIVLLNALLVSVLMLRYCNRHLGGYTGDCLGAVQQLSEVVVYLSWAALVG